MTDPCSLDPRIDTDLVIIGAGLAGLSIAAWLDQLVPKGQPLPTVTLIETGTANTNDRTWCFWDQAPHPFSDIIEYRWPRWQVSKGSHTVEREDAAHGYALLSAARLREHARTRIAERPELRLMRGVRAGEITRIPGGRRLATSAGAIHSRLVIDTRAPDAEALRADQGLWQIFQGLELHAPGHGLDLETARLMDFQPGTDGVHFMYLLPFDQNRLLAEWTCFHPDRHAPDMQALLDHQQVPDRLQRWLAKALPGGFEIERHESGCLPMMPVTAKAPADDQRYLSAGIGGGWMRPATGYMFASCQRGSEALARQLLDAQTTGTWTLSAPPLRRASLDWMDKVFLRAMRRHPQQGADWFMALFAHTSAAQQRRFLGDSPTFTDLIAVMRALPPLPFMASALTQLFTRR